MIDSKVTLYGTEKHPDHITRITAEVCNELAQAESKFGPFNSSHEGYAVLLEEVDELWDVVKLNPKKIDGDGKKIRNQRMREEAIQIAAMAIKFIKCVCDAERTEY